VVSVEMFQIVKRNYIQVPFKKIRKNLLLILPTFSFWKKLSFCWRHFFTKRWPARLPVRWHSGGRSTS